MRKNDFTIKEEKSFEKSIENWEFTVVSWKEAKDEKDMILEAVQTSRLLRKKVLV